MRRSVLDKLTRTIARPLICVTLAMFAIPLIAQPGDSREYDVSKEVTISGAISGVVAQTTRGMLMGAHLMVTTTSGEVDASLGRWAMQGKDALSVTVGQQIELTGMMQTLNGKEVFITRTLKAGGKVYTLRNQHGIELSPQTRQRAAEKGESL
jgi:hypothetical protein